MKRILLCISLLIFANFSIFSFSETIEFDTEEVINYLVNEDSTNGLEKSLHGLKVSYQQLDQSSDMMSMMAESLRKYYYLRVRKDEGEELTPQEQALMNQLTSVIPSSDYEMSLEEIYARYVSPFAVGKLNIVMSISDMEYQIKIMKHQSQMMAEREYANFLSQKQTFELAQRIFEIEKKSFENDKHNYSEGLISRLAFAEKTLEMKRKEQKYFSQKRKFEISEATMKHRLEIPFTEVVIWDDRWLNDEDKPLLTLDYYLDHARNSNSNRLKEQVRIKEEILSMVGQYSAYKEKEYLKAKLAYDQSVQKVVDENINEEIEVRDKYHQANSAFQRYSEAKASYENRFDEFYTLKDKFKNKLVDQSYFDEAEYKYLKAKYQMMQADIQYRMAYQSLVFLMKDAVEE